MTDDLVAPVSRDDLTTVTGGFFRGRGRGPGGRPSTPMELLDKPQRTLNHIKDFLGIPPSGNPGDRYIPATANPDGSINPGRFEPPPHPDGVQVPQSR